MGVAVHCPRDLTRGEGGVRAAARPGESDLLLRSGVARGPIAEPKISRKIVAGQPQLSRFGETLAELPPTGDQVALFRSRLGRFGGSESGGASFMAAVLSQGAVKALLSDDHFSVDGTLIEAWASMKSFRPKDGSGEPPAAGRNGERDFRGEKRSNEPVQQPTRFELVINLKTAKALSVTVPQSLFARADEVIK